MQGPAEASIKDIQTVELELLLELDQLCSVLNVPYVLYFGTLLGAVRHKGFIPWDDDIDVVMLREDYDRFIRECPPLLPTHYFLQTLDTDPEYPYTFAKLRDSRTTFIEAPLANKEINHGIYIDIFPLDGVPSHPIVRRLGWYMLSAVGRLNILKAFDERYAPRSTFEKGMVRIVPFSERYLRRLYSKLVTFMGTRRTKYVAHSSFPSIAINRLIYEKEWVFDTVSMEFEGRSFTAPRNFDGPLRRIYGDYMTPPPVEKRVSTHTLDSISTKVPYTKYDRGNKEP
jgi:lipopolysaccharide cholinephosphotransferase